MTTLPLRIPTFLALAVHLAAPARAELPVPTMPYTPPAAAKRIPGAMVDQVIRQKVLPGVTAREGAEAAMRRVATDPRMQSHVVGHLAESDFIARNPQWRQVSNPRAPQNDVFTFVKGKFQGGQIKTHASGNPKLYMSDMIKDYRAEQFLVPDDHLPATRKAIQERINLMKQRGNTQGVARWERNLQRLKPLGRNYQELESSIVSRAGKVVKQGKVIRTGAVCFAVTLVVEGGVVVYRSASGELTPTQTGCAAAEGVAKAGTVGLVTGGMVLAGANPVGITVIVVGGVAYFVVDYAIGTVRPAYWSSSMTAADIEALLPQDWRLHDPLDWRRRCLQ